MSYKDLYTIDRKGANYVCYKVDKDFEPTGHYDISVSPTGKLECACFASIKETCRHRTMVTLFEAAGLVGSHRWYNFDKGKWVDAPMQEA